MIITAGIYKGRKIISPSEKITRPTLSKTRMGVFNSLFSIIGDFEGKTFLDLFGGSGIMGLEALSRGFAEVKVCEINKTSAEIIKKNYRSLGLEADLYFGDSLKFVSQNTKCYDVIYIDPPYKSGIYDEIIQKVKTNGKIIIAEHDNTIDFSKYTVLKQKNYGGSLITYIGENN